MNLDTAEDTDGQAVSFMYHPTFLTDSREDVAEWIRAVLGRNGIYQRDFMKTMPFNSDYPVDYSYYVWISDVWMDIIDPALLKAGDLDGRDLQIPTGMLSEIAWYAADADAIYQAARKHGVRVVNQSGQVIEETSLPKGTSLVSSDVVLMWLHPDDVGLSVEIANLTPDMEKLATRFLFPRHHPDWRPPELDLHDPMGIIRGAFHTVWTNDLRRALRGTVDVLGGTVFHEVDVPHMDARCTYVYLAESVIEYAVPNDPDRLRDMPRAQTLLSQSQQDIYHGISFVVKDLAAVRDRFERLKIGLTLNRDNRIEVDPADSFGLRWGFVSEFIPGDPRSSEIGGGPQ